QIDIYTNRKATGTVSANSQLPLPDSNPTGLATSGRTGNWFVVDSTVQATAPNKYVQLYIFNNGGTQLSGSPYKIYLGTAPTDTGATGLDTDATTETNFKLQYDTAKNILYLIAPNVGRVYAMTLPDYF